MVLIALGGNALIKKGEKGDISTQERNADEMCGFLMDLVEMDYNIVITHGNGPQVGQQLIRHEKAKEFVPELPLDVLVAETEGNIGYFLQQAFLNQLKRRDLYRYIVTVITQVIVDRSDPAFANPSKPIGTFMTEDEAEVMKEKFDWKIIEDSGRGYRRVVPSPQPIKVVQRHMIRHSAREGNIVIAGGGGGIPICVKENGDYEGVEAVIDKDLTSALLATETRADLLVILMPLNRVSIHFNTPEQRELERVTLEEAERYMREGHFPEGSIGPKVQAIINFLETGGEHAIITRADLLKEALEGRAGTHFHRM